MQLNLAVILIYSCSAVIVHASLLARIFGDRIFEDDTNGPQKLLRRDSRVACPPCPKCTADESCQQVIKCPEENNDGGIEQDAYGVQEESHIIGKRETCGSTFYASSGEFHSPGYPNRCVNNQDCYWIISAQPGTYIRVEILDMEIEFHRKCMFDKLIIRDGGNVFSPKIGLICGGYNKDNPPVFKSTGNTLFVHYKTDDLHCSKGFSAKWETVFTESTCPPCPGCLDSTCPPPTHCTTSVKRQTLNPTIISSLNSTQSYGWSTFNTNTAHPNYTEVTAVNMEFLTTSQSKNEGTNFNKHSSSEFGTSANNHIGKPTIPGQNVDASNVFSSLPTDYKTKLLKTTSTDIQAKSSVTPETDAEGSFSIISHPKDMQMSTNKQTFNQNSIMGLSTTLLYDREVSISQNSLQKETMVPKIEQTSSQSQGIEIHNNPIHNSISLNILDNLQIGSEVTTTHKAAIHDTISNLPTSEDVRHTQSQNVNMEFLTATKSENDMKNISEQSSSEFGAPANNHTGKPTILGYKVIASDVHSTLSTDYEREKSKTTSLEIQPKSTVTPETYSEKKYLINSHQKDLQMPIIMQTLNKNSNTVLPTTLVNDVEVLMDESSLPKETMVAKIEQTSSKKLMTETHTIPIHNLSSFNIIDNLQKVPEMTTSQIAVIYNISTDLPTTKEVDLHLNKSKTNTPKELQVSTKYENMQYFHRMAPMPEMFEPETDYFLQDESALDVDNYPACQSSSCPEGMFRIKSQCFKWHRTPASWDDANELCLIDGLALAEPLDPSLLAMHICESFHGEGLPWLGGRGTGTEVLMNSGKSITTEEWNFTEPKRKTTDYCLKLSSCSSFPYSVMSCGLSKPFVCGCNLDQF